MSFANGHAKMGGRQKGKRNKRMLDAAPRLDALDHIEKVMASDDGTISPDVRLRAATVLAAYQHSRPAPTRTETFVVVNSYAAPKTVEEARLAILELGLLLAKGGVSVEAMTPWSAASKPISAIRRLSNRRSSTSLKPSCPEEKNNEL